MQEIAKIVCEVRDLFLKKSLTLSVAESCTGGLICHYLTTLPGAGAFFKAGVVTYSNESKKAILGLSAETISTYGSVSEQTAKEMAEKVRALLNTDYSISTTGNLGPDVLEGKEKGLVYITVSSKNQTFSEECRLTGNREDNKEMASLFALKFIVKILTSQS